MQKVLIICSALIIVCLFLVLWQNANKAKIPINGERNELEAEYLPQTSAEPENAPSGDEKPALVTPYEEEAEPLISERAFYRELREQYQNEDIIGYLKIVGTSIDYPVTQAQDNEYYLDYDIYKNESTSGWIFLDYENDIARNDRNTVIYGHNMKKNIMFHSLRYYASEDYYKEHRYIIFNTAYEDAVWEIFAFYKSDVSFRYIQVIFPTQDFFYDLVCQMKERASYDTGVAVSPEDRILTLSTCTGGASDERYAISARRLSPDEIPEELKNTGSDD